MKRFVVRKYKPLYQPHALHPLVHLFVRSVQQPGGGFDTSGYKSHNHLCLGYFNNILHNEDIQGCKYTNLFLFIPQFPSLQHHQQEGDGLRLLSFE